MSHRSLSDIFPAYYPLPDEEDIARKCRAHFSTAQRVDDLTRWIEHEDCPYMREAYAEGMYQVICQGIDENDMDYMMSTATREDVEVALNRIIRFSRTDQLAEEMCISEQPIPHSNSPREQHITAMEKQMAYLTQEVAAIKSKLEAPSQPMMWPTYCPNVAEADKYAFENQVRTICLSKKKDLTQQLKTYLEMKVKDGTIVRPEQQNTEWEVLKKFNYPFKEKSYYNS
ncbi:MAG: hypothetical protein MJZ64_05430 [Paludibacteraceae bacterium]|nr:hypothetical protein [Paludibacteraceae bacterium]